MLCEILKSGREDGVVYFCLTLISCALFSFSCFSFFVSSLFAPMCLDCGVFVHFFVLCAAPLFFVGAVVSLFVFFIFDIFGLCSFFLQDGVSRPHSNQSVFFLLLSILLLLCFLDLLFIVVGWFHVLICLSLLFFFVFLLLLLHSKQNTN